MLVFNIYQWSMAKARCAVLAALVCASPVLAADINEAKTFDIKPQPMDRALVDFSKQAGFQVVANSAGVEKLQTRGVTGTRRVSLALEELLAGSGLSYRVIEPNVIVVEQGQAKSDAAPGGPARAGPIVAQASSPSDFHRAESIMVTAQKREERLIDVPASIGVVTRDDIERRRLVNAEDYLRGIPGVSQVESAYGQSIVIRGIETSPFFQNFFTGTTVATHFGETPTTNSAGLLSGTNIDLKLVDIERVEVLRGPQGTAFGSGSLGGAVRTIPVAPRLDRFEGKVAAGYSATSGNGGDNYNVQAVANVPLIQNKLAIRGVAYQYQDGGYYRNHAGSDAAFRAAVVTPFGAEALAADAEKVGSYHVKGGRIAALYEPSDDLRLTLSYLSQKNETDGMPLANSGIYEQTVLQVGPEHVVRGVKAGQIDLDVDIANVMMEYNLGWGSLVATYSHTKGRSIQSNPWAAISLPFPVSNLAKSNNQGNVGEIRVTTQLDGAWNFLAGVYLEDTKDEGHSDNHWYGDPARNIFGTDPSLGIRSDVRGLKQKAAFGEASWRLPLGLTLTGGIRAYEYSRTYRVDASGFFFGGATGIHESRETKASGENFRANLNYKLGTDGLLYTSWSQGFRLGQPQNGLPRNLCDLNGDGVVDGTGINIDSTRLINSDTLNSYELGGKFSPLDGRLTIMAAVFRMDWSDVPTEVRPGTGACILPYIANAGKARSDGVEFQTHFLITKALRLDLGGSWINATLTEDAPALRAVKGNRLPAPKVNANLGVQYAFDIGSYKAFARGDAIYVGSFFGDLAQSPNLKTDKYVKIDASAGVKVGNASIDFFVHNLTNEDAVTFRGTLIGANPFFAYRLRPRTIGFQVGYTF